MKEPLEYPAHTCGSEEQFNLEHENTACEGREMASDQNIEKDGKVLAQAAQHGTVDDFLAALTPFQKNGGAPSADPSAQVKNVLEAFGLDAEAQTGLIEDANQGAEKTTEATSQTLRLLYGASGKKL